MCNRADNTTCADRESRSKAIQHRENLKPIGGQNGHKLS